MRHCVWSRNPVNEEALAHLGLLHQKQTNKPLIDFVNRTSLASYRYHGPGMKQISSYRSTCERKCRRVPTLTIQGWILWEWIILFISLMKQQSVIIIRFTVLQEAKKKSLLDRHLNMLLFRKIQVQAIFLWKQEFDGCVCKPFPKYSGNLSLTNRMNYDKLPFPELSALCNGYHSKSSHIIRHWFVSRECGNERNLRVGWERNTKWIRVWG